MFRDWSFGSQWLTSTNLVLVTVQAASEWGLKNKVQLIFLSVLPVILHKYKHLEHFNTPYSQD